MKILVVDDHLDSAEFMQQVLLSAGHAVEIAGSAVDAIAAVHQSSFDLFFLDLALPDQNGWSLLHELRKLTAAPAVAISGMARVQEINRSLAAGFARHLVKPVDLHELLNVARRFDVASSSPSDDDRMQQASTDDR